MLYSHCSNHTRRIVTSSFTPRPIHRTSLPNATTTTTTTTAFCPNQRKYHDQNSSSNSNSNSNSNNIGKRSWMSTLPQSPPSNNNNNNNSSSSSTRSYQTTSHKTPPHPTTTTTTTTHNNNASSEPSSIITKPNHYHHDHHHQAIDPTKPGSVAFADGEISAIADLFFHFAKTDGGVDDEGTYICRNGMRELMMSIGERPDDETLEMIFSAADMNDDGKLHLTEFLIGADKVLGGSPARTVLVVGGPGSGKGLLCARLEVECDVVHLSSGELLRKEVFRDTPLGRECAKVMARGELVSSAVITTLIRRRMRNYPGRRVLLDGFPRSLENCRDFVDLCGKPELALHLDCDDTILMERILNRAKQAVANGGVGSRADDTIETALKRLRTYHKFHKPTMDWLREECIPVVNLDCSGSPENVWEQLLAIGRLMRPVARHKEDIAHAINKNGKVQSDDVSAPFALGS